MFEYIKEYLKTEDVEYKENVKISAISPINIGGNAHIVILPKNKTDIAKILGFLDGDNIRYKILGNMSNVLPSDDDFHGIIVKTDRMTEYSVNNDIISCDCGIKLPYLAALYLKHGFSGFEQLSGIPGQLGGAVYGNAGAFGREISELICSCTVYDKQSGDVHRLKESELEFYYRRSCFSDNRFVILSVELKAFLSEERTVRRVMNEFKDKRRAAQPVGQPTLGSVFKRPAPDISAGKLIDECGLRGFILGGAQISSKHAGFIVNIGGATSENVKKLIDMAREAVRYKFGIDLECEIEFL